MRLPERVEVKSDVMMGKPCIRGTRIPIYLILQEMAAGERDDQLLESPRQAERLRRLGYDASAIAEIGLSGAADPVVRSTGSETGRILVTLDGDFGG